MSNENQLEKIVLTILRVSLGWVFFWAFLDKTFGLGFATSSENSWINGGNPTFGFLMFGTEGTTFQDFFQGMADSGLVEWLFMLGLFGIGLATILGIGRKIAGASGVILMILMWLAQLPLTNNPFMDDHIIYALVFSFFAVSKRIGYVLIPQWEKNEFVSAHPILL